MSADAQAEFEESQARKDVHLLRKEHKKRTVVKQAFADAKAFQSRGFRGKIPEGLTDQERREFVKKKAREVRVNAYEFNRDTNQSNRKVNTELMSREMKNFMISEGMAVPKRLRREKLIKRLAKRPVSYYVNRFTRFGELPMFTVDELHEIRVKQRLWTANNHVDGNALRRMIQAMLSMSGIESNPGPCEYSGVVITGENFRVKGRKILKCPSCSMTLQRLGSSSRGKHPVCHDFLCEPTGEGKHQNCTVEMPFPQQDLPLRPRSAPCVGRFPKRPVVEEQQCALSMNREVKPEPPTVAEPLRVLSGHGLKMGDCIDALERVSDIVFDEMEIVVKSKICSYDREQRMLVQRNVIETKADFDVAQIEGTHYYFSRNWWHLVTCLFTILTLGVLVVAYSYLDFEILGFEIARIGIVVAFTLIMLCFLISFSWLLTKRWCHVQYKIAFVPHLVSCLVSEYDRGTNISVARSTMRGKLRRMASFPLPDKDALTLLHGTEIVAEALLSRQDFYSAGATMF
jgi:hypothetical protein